MFSKPIILRRKTTASRCIVYVKMIFNNDPNFYFMIKSNQLQINGGHEIPTQSIVNI